LRAVAVRVQMSMQGMSGESIAVLLVAGLVLGTFPVYGCPTALCLLAALLFRWNAPALQLVNQLVAPLQWALIVPFAKVGERILQAPAPGGTLSRLGAFLIHAVAGWLCLALPLGLLVYLAVSLGLRQSRPAADCQLESPAH